MHALNRCHTALDAPPWARGKVGGPVDEGADVRNTPLARGKVGGPLDEVADVRNTPAGAGRRGAATVTVRVPVEAPPRRGKD